MRSERPRLGILRNYSVSSEQKSPEDVIQGKGQVPVTGVLIDQHYPTFHIIVIRCSKLTID
jgi:hypothetical protein